MAMFSEEEVFRAARTLIQAHGERAAGVAEMRAAGALKHHNAGSHAIWLRIAHAVRLVQRYRAKGRPDT